MNMQTFRTPVLEIAAEVSGPESGSPVFLVHGWPDTAATWRKIAPPLNAAGFRTVAPYLRGTAPTKFLSRDTLRVGHAVALAQDVIELADLLGWREFAVVGHDWGARTAYTLAAIAPERLTRIAAMSVAYSPRGLFHVAPFPQARRFWYQWFMSTDPGADAVRRDPAGFARIQWDTWSPSGWFTEADFAVAAESFQHPDWVAVTLSSYRSRWRPEPSDPRYDALQQKLAATETIAVPTLMLQGSADFCDEPSSSEDQDRYFTGGYARHLIEGAGHFLPREAPDEVSRLLLAHLSGTPPQAARHTAAS
jgi:pimeloyl-ACP methyl ester carboxylesterase